MQEIVLLVALNLRFGVQNIADPCFALWLCQPAARSLPHHEKPHYGYEPQQRSIPGNMYLQNNMTPRFHDGCHVQGQARTMKSTRLCTFMQKGVLFVPPDLWANTSIKHAMRARSEARFIKIRRGAASHGFRFGLQFALNGVLWFELVESFLLYVLGGVFFYPHYLRWSVFLSRFRIIILKERGATTGLHHGSEKLICARSLWGRGCRQNGNCCSK